MNFVNNFYYERIEYMFFFRYNAKIASPLMSLKFLSYHRFSSVFIVILIVFSLFFQGIFSSKTEASFIEIITYKGRLMNDQGTPLQDSYNFRFSLWKINDYIPSDSLPTNEINTAAPHYSGWQEEHIAYPDANGNFILQLGTITPLPDLDFNIHKYLQIDVKPLGVPVSEYELMDYNGDNGADDKDRKSLGLPYALNAERSLSAFDEIFTLDPDDVIEAAGSGEIKLKFGKLLDKYLAYSMDDGVFRFNDSVDITGDLTLSGTVNGVDVTLVDSLSHLQNTDTGTNADTFKINTDGNSLTLDATGLTKNRTITFDDANTHVVGADNTQTMINKTMSGDNNTFVNIDRSSLKNQNNVILISPEFKHMTIHQDGTDNMGSIRQGNDMLNKQQYYVFDSYQPTLQDLELHILVPIPNDFVAWQSTPVRLSVKNSSTNILENQLDISLEDSTQTAVVLVGGEDIIASQADTWEDFQITFGGNPVFIAGESMLLKVKLQAHSAHKMYVGYIRLNYVGK